MAISRRAFIGSAAAASAWGALSLAGAREAAAASPPGDVGGKNDGNHPWAAGTCLDVVNWFKGLQLSSRPGQKNSGSIQ